MLRVRQLSFMRKITSYEIVLSALSCALATIVLVAGAYSEVLLATGYLLGSVSMMLPLAKRSFRGAALAYVATCILAFIFGAAKFLDLLPFVMFFGLHPLVNELQLKININRWVACLIKAAWFDITMYILWRFVFVIVSGYSFLDAYILPVILTAGTVFFIFYDYAMYRWRAWVNRAVERIAKK